MIQEAKVKYPKDCAPGLTSTKAKPRNIDSLLLKWADRLVAAITFSLFFTLIVQDAHAYIDPGTGTAIWQAIFAGIVGAMFYVRKALSRFASRGKQGDK